MLSEESFYGGISLAQRRIEKLLEKKALPKIIQLPSYLNKLLGPSRAWKIFDKQAKAVDYVESHKSGLMPFSFEQKDGGRLFLVCHPLILWFVQGQRPESERCTYEIIREKAPCKLYLDIEFEYAFNPGKDFNCGERMVNVFIKMFINFLREELDLQYQHKCILDLDSSTITKFSRHIIFKLEEHAFINNATTGRIVKAFCDKLIEFSSNASIDSMLYDVTKESVCSLEVFDRKGIKKLFVDHSVYSRNRHFRILGSTKRHKNSALTLSTASSNRNDNEEQIFLNSLVTYFDEKHLKLIEYGQPNNDATKYINLLEPRNLNKMIPISLPLDDYINMMISPCGRIRQRLYLKTHYQYDIAGYRYCGNIGREHRSNNISYHIDLLKMIMYQTCYDPDCKGYKSPPVCLPPEVTLPSDEDAILLEVANNLLSDQDLLNFVNSDYSLVDNQDDLSTVFHFEWDKCSSMNDDDEFPDMNISDENLLEIASNAEEVLVLDT